MKTTLIILFLGTTLYANNCWKIKNPDTKALCESRFEGKRNCWKIKNNDLKYYCEAVAYAKNSCWKIQKSDDKEMCIAETK